MGRGTGIRDAQDQRGWKCADGVRGAAGSTAVKTSKQVFYFSVGGGSAARPKKMPKKKTSDFPAVLFDLDGTLIDSVYEHIRAWREALGNAGIALAGWKIHQR